jgi:hypothetical protein
MNKTPAQSLTGVERQGHYCKHDILVISGRECGLCARHPDLYDSEFQQELGTNETGWGWNDELAW